ncbi:leucyl/phenylalanyl-tRNA--protein transferase [Candidatus Sulfidibacterium hydrothermale]|uniref:leucyl/phenylalanyl-tRNA--protein transferase n=1 Tax=Candidatus Sulfidibacterium hydrothermale TaxID=2875962 RepID=UPI001F0AAFA4|nr:leucyl/phenylalanyl-tRNA--protein transferase [Candidatus Sulfidibacterium hydrothermale]UBM61958.1 leucyl/phenylalanyl-tRNA--protein transferase [Candidatus Sulfidibacterium hydrothermale]
MPVYQLPEEPVFPRPELAEPDGLLAVGGDLSPQRLLNAYASGIFPWYNEDSPILWWSPDPRLVLFPEEFKRHKNLRRLVQRGKFNVTINHDFQSVIKACSRVKRKNQTDTWITPEMQQAYIRLHELGFALSVECYLDEKLAGGLYGVVLGKVFFGESMFHTVTDASKVALWHLVDFLLKNHFKVIDVQQDTPHLRSLGARLIPRKEFLNLLKENIR